MTTFSAFTAHLKADEVKGTKEYEVKQLMDILGLIAKEKDRISNVKEYCKNCFGTDANGAIKADPINAHKMKIHIMAKQRLTAYYNLKATKLTKF